MLGCGWDWVGLGLAVGRARLGLVVFGIRSGWYVWGLAHLGLGKVGLITVPTSQD